MPEKNRRGMNIELTDDELSILRIALQDYIRGWIGAPFLSKQNQREYKLYQKLGGYDEFFSGKELAILKSEMPEEEKG